MATCSTMMQLRACLITGLPFRFLFTPLFSCSPSKSEIDSAIDPELPWAIPEILQKSRRTCNTGSVIIERRSQSNSLVGDYTRSITGQRFTNKGMKFLQWTRDYHDLLVCREEWRTATDSILSDHATMNRNNSVHPLIYCPQGGLC